MCFEELCEKSPNAVLVSGNYLYAYLAEPSNITLNVKSNINHSI